MALVTKILTLAACLTLAFGQLARITFFGIEFPLIDLILPLLALTNITIYFRTQKPRPPINRYFLIFLLIALISFGLNQMVEPFSLRSFFYLIRLASLISFFSFPPSISFWPYIQLALISNILFGFIQYFVWPNFIPFSSLQWDPHTNRLVSSFFDPTFTGLIYLLFLIYLYFSKNSFPQILKNLLMVLTYLALALTYSRSTILAFAAIFGFIAVVNKQLRLALQTLIIVAFTLLLLPRMPGESTKLERTSSLTAKIQNYQQGLQLFAQHPLVGVGYNFIPKYRTDVNRNSHAVGGFDGSLLTILVSTGIFGFIFFCIGIFTYFQKSDLFHRSLLLAILLHSLFANSLLYPFTILVLFFL